MLRNSSITGCTGCLQVNHEEVRLRRDRRRSQAPSARAIVFLRMSIVTCFTCAWTAVSLIAAAPPHFTSALTVPVSNGRSCWIDFRRRDGVAEPHAGQRRDLRERARDDHRPAFDDVRHRRRVVRIVNEVVIGLVDQDRHVVWQAVQERRIFALRDDDAGRVVGIAEIDEADLTVVPFRRP